MKRACYWEKDNRKREINLSTITIDTLKEMAYYAKIDQFQLTSSTVSEEIQILIDKLADPWSLCIIRQLDLKNVDVTPQILQLLQKLMNAQNMQQLPLPPSQVFPLQNEYYKTVGFNIKLFDCKISQCSTHQDHDDQGGNDNGNEYENDTENICSALEEVYRLPNIREFSVINSPTVADCLMTAQEISDTDALTVSSTWQNEYVVEMRTNLKDLQLKIGVEAPERLESLLTAACSLNSFSLQSVRFNDSNPIPNDSIICGICNQAVTRFLHDPNSQLQDLTLSFCNLDDDYLITILDSLPTLQLKTLNVSFNNIQSRGVMEFARRLPNIKILTFVVLTFNPWEESTDREECSEALVHGMMHNTSIEYFCFSREYPPSQAPLIVYYSSLNRVRRILLLVSTPVVPLGLWPWILMQGKTRPHYEADMIYFLLQNSPILTLYGDRGYEIHTHDDGIRQHFTKFFSCLIQPFSI